MRAALVIDAALAAALVILFVVLVRAKPTWGIAIWLCSVAFLPVWLGTSFIVYFMPATIVGILVLAGSIPLPVRRVGLADLTITVLLLAAIAPILIGGGTLTTVFGVLSQWVVGFLLGRMLRVRVPEGFVYRAIAVIFTIIAVLAIAEYVFRANFFVRIGVGRPLYSSWGSLQLRGNVPRAEGAFGVAIAFGASMAMAVPLTLASSFSLWIRLLMSILQAGSIAVTFSRTGMICAGAGIALTLLVGRDPALRRVRWPVLAVFAVVVGALAPLISSVFDSAGSEATISAGYRTTLLQLVPDFSVIGLSSVAHRTTSGDLFFGHFQSIDNQLILTGLTYGWLPLAFGLLLLAAAILAVVRNRAAPATIAVVAQIPALATVALVTQYSIFFWFVAGLAVAGQIGFTVPAAGRHDRGSAQLAGVGAAADDLTSDTERQRS